jgi:hypothetical protein
VPRRVTSSRGERSRRVLRLAEEYAAEHWWHGRFRLRSGLVVIALLDLALVGALVLSLTEAPVDVPHSVGILFAAVAVPVATVNRVLAMARRHASARSGSPTTRR